MSSPTNTKDSDIWKSLEDAAWKVRENASVLGPIKVGAALLSDSGRIFSGCNIEHPFRVKDIHAEVNAISCMIAEGIRHFTHIVVVSEQTFFTPCGSCMDWIMLFSGEECEIGVVNGKGTDMLFFKGNDLMPFYPKE